MTTMLMVMDDIANIKIAKDSSFAMLLEAQRRGWNLRYTEIQDLYWRDGQARLRHQALRVRDDQNGWHTLSDEKDNSGDDFDVVLMRKDPPFDMEYVAATWWLDAIRGLVVNPPQLLRDWNEKLATVHFPQCCPTTLVSRDTQRLQDFVDELGDVIIKPLDGMGGAGIYRLRKDDPNRNIILETSTGKGQRSIMAQQFLPAVSEGDKRILIVDGEAIPYALARIPAKGETRANLATGGSGVGQALSEHDHWIAKQLGPTLKDQGLLFVGIDVIGQHLTEINITSPTCIRELDEQFSLNISATLFDAIEKRLA